VILSSFLRVILGMTDIIAHNRIDFTGQKINMLTVLHPVKKNAKTVHWRCRCDCGRELDMTSIVLRRKPRVKSCGCQRTLATKKRMWKGYKEISKSYWSRLQAGAKERGLEFSLSIEDAWKLFIKQNRICGLTGLPLSFSTCIKRKVEEQTASLDRIDSSKGYVKGNVMWVHKKINILKLNMDNEEFIHWCFLVSEHKKTLDTFTRSS
jgi:hypothetical protein